jgi:hypothetical protein
MNVEKFFEVLGILFTEKNDVKIKSITVKQIKYPTS